MSTRSGKRIHSTFENIQELDINQVQVKSERKNRSKRRKDNTDDSNAVLNNTAHYVHYPGDDALNDVEKTSRKLRRHTLKEHSVSVTKKQNTDDNFDMEKPRHTRKSKRFLQESELNTVDNSKLGEKEMIECPKKNKKNKNKKQNIAVEVNEKIEEAKENVPKNKKKSKKKKHLKQSGVLQVEDVNKENIENSTQNKINVSNDSFHSAAGSLESVKPNGSLRKLAEDTSSDQDNSDDLQKSHKKSVTPKILRRKSSLVIDADDDSRTINDVVEEGSTTKRKLSRSKKSVEQTVEAIQLSDIDYPAKKVKAKKADSSFNSSNTKVNVTFEKSNLNNDNTDDKTEDAHNDTYDKSNEKIKINPAKKVKAKKADSSFNSSNTKVNVTFEKSNLNNDNTDDKTEDAHNDTYDKSNEKIKINPAKKVKAKKADSSFNSSNTKVNVTFEKSNLNNDNTDDKTEDAHNDTYDKSNEKIKINPAKKVKAKKADSSFNSSNTKVNVTFEKSNLNNDNTDDKTEDAHNDTYDKSNEKIKINPAKKVKAKKADSSFNSSNTKVNVTFEKSNLNNDNTDDKTEDAHNDTYDKSNEKIKINPAKKVKAKKADSSFNSSNTKVNVTFEKSNLNNDNTDDKTEDAHNDTYDKSNEKIKINPAKKVKAKKADSSFNSSNTKVNVTFEKSNLNNDNTDDKTEDAHNDTYDKSNEKINHTFEKSDQKLNETFEKSSDDGSKSKCVNNKVPQTRSKRKSLYMVTNDESATKQNLNSTFEKSPNIFKLNKKKSLDTTLDKESGGESHPIKDQVQSTNKKSDLINTTLDKSTNDSHISINSDDSKTENIINTTPQLIESSMEETSIHSSPKPLSPQLSTEIEVKPTTPLKREGTFTKDNPKAETPKARQPTTPRSKETRLSMIGTPDRRKSYTSPGRTPFPSSKTSEQKRKTLNVTHSIEKSVTRTSLVETMPRTTKVMFCSPINSPAVTSQIKRKVIKSNLKGSNKSFVFDESMSDVNRSATRKRSYTQSEADTVSRKRLRFGEEMQQSIDRLSRPRTVSATAKLSEPSTPSKKTPTKARPEAKVSRTKLPNFAALHQKRFEKMESLDECQERKAKRARQLLTPTGSANILERISPKENAVDSPKTSHAKEAKNHTIQSLNPGYTRFGFRMDCEDNPFTKKQTDVKKGKANGLTRQGTFPSLAGTTSVRREAAKQTVMREKSFTEKRDTKRKENRTIIKGVRTNRRFELQMKMRNINA